MILKEKQRPIPWNIFREQTMTLLSYAEKLDSSKIQFILKQILPTYKPKIFEPTSKQSLIEYNIKGKAKYYKDYEETQIPIQNVTLNIDGDDKFSSGCCPKSLIRAKTTGINGWDEIH